MRNPEGIFRASCFCPTSEKWGFEHQLSLVNWRRYCKRVNQFTTFLDIDTEIFDSPETFNQLCLMSGGHVRNLLLLTQDAIARTAQLPISQRAVRRAITEARNTYRQTVEHSQWDLLAEVFRSKRVINDNKYRSLLFNRCLLEYRYLDEDEEIQRWCDVHPLIKGIPEFKELVKKNQS
ncbi:MAG: hypothetical protein ACFB02_17610 [Mastigocoleus sp.]